MAMESCRTLLIQLLSETSVMVKAQIPSALLAGLPGTLAWVHSGGGPPRRPRDPGRELRLCGDSVSVHT